MYGKARSLHLAALLLVAAATTPASWSQRADNATEPVVSGLDHVVVAVRDLADAARRYRELGFTLKPGVLHENGIENRHAKFRDGTEIELLSAREARDPLTTEHVRLLAADDGPAFLALYAPDTDALVMRLNAAGMAYQRNGDYVSLRKADYVPYVFFGKRNASPTDRPEHFAHANGAFALRRIWIAANDLGAERALLTSLGANLVTTEVARPDARKATVAKFPEGDVVLLDGAPPLVPGRRIVGATVLTRDLDALRQVLAASQREIPAAVKTAEGTSIFLPPTATQGLWLEFLERRQVAHGVATRCAHSMRILPFSTTSFQRACSFAM